MKLNKKLIVSLTLLAPILFACAGGSEGGGGENPPDPTPPDPTPPDPEPEEFKGLKFIATQDGSKVGYSINGELPDIHIQCSLDDGITWNDWDGTDKELNTSNTLCVRNSSNTLNDISNSFNFTMTGEISSSGDISSMINGSSLSDYCFQSMFKNCTSLILAPELPFDTLTEGCYENMFEGCTSLTSVPELPATTLKDYCYFSMFDSCTSLKIKEDESTDGGLIFTCSETSNLIDPVKYMFNTTDGSFGGTPIAGCTYYWYLDELDPSEEFEGLKLTATQANSTIGYSITGTIDTSGIQYSRDKGITWKNWAYNSSTKNGENITLNDGRSLYVRNNNNTLSVNNTKYFQFTMSGKIEASGDISSMINGSDLSAYCYYDLFSGCAALTSAPKLPATNLADACYCGMFARTSLTSAPELPATTLKKMCYESMFIYCSNLIAPPSELKAEKLIERCYQSMFAFCYNLLSAPTLYANEIDSQCCCDTFYKCTSLKISENGPKGAKKVFVCPDSVTDFYTAVDGMFKDTGGSFKDMPTKGNTYYCIEPLKFTATQDNSKIGYSVIGRIDTSGIQYSKDCGVTWVDWAYDSSAQKGEDITLNNGKFIYVRNSKNKLSENDFNSFQFTMSGKIEASGDISSMINYSELSEYCFKGMFYGCAALTSAPILPATTLKQYCYYSMFFNCTSLASAPELPATTLADKCYSFMFDGCSSLVLAPILPADTLEASCYEDMFFNCTALTSAPELPATKLTHYCYKEMFYNCSSLKVKEDEATDGVLIFTCPETEDVSYSVDNMFYGTSGDFSGTPTTTHKYYWYTKEQTSSIF